MKVWTLASAIALSACTPPSAQESSSGGSINLNSETDNAIIAANLALDAAANVLAAQGEAGGDAQEPTGWAYSTSADPMADEKTELACVQSSNTIFLSSPYGETSARLSSQFAAVWPRCLPFA